jgi:hypothetical protein
MEQLSVGSLQFSISTNIGNEKFINNKKTLPKIWQLKTVNCKL